jgi:HEAT repeat protein
MGPAGQDAALLAALEDQNAEIRMRAALALSLSAGEASVAQLLRKLVESATEDRTAVGIALSGALSRSGDTSATLVLPALATASEAVRDALIEGLGRTGGRKSGSILASWLAQRSFSAADRRKTAEALAGHGEQGAALKALLLDADREVRAAAAWSAGFSPKGPEADALLARVSELMGDPSVDVAVNATAAAALLARTLGKGSPAAEVLCRAVIDFRPYVRANALAGLALLGTRCGDGQIERKALAQDPSDIVRQAAAQLLWRVPAGSAVEADGRALVRCLADDKSGRVVRACRAALPSATEPNPVVIFVIPDGQSSPLAAAPYALLRADGLIRAGIADRRGAVFERFAPVGELSLLLPAALPF